MAVGGGRGVSVCVGRGGGGVVHMQKMPGVFYPFMREPGSSSGIAERGS